MVLFYTVMIIPYYNLNLNFTCFSLSQCDVIFCLMKHCPPMLSLRTSRMRRHHQLSNRKRKNPPGVINKSSNEITKCKDCFKSNEGISLCSELVKVRVKTGAKLMKREMAAINATMEYSSAYGQEFASNQCPAGGSVSWLASCDRQENLEQEYLTVENAAIDC